MGKRQRRGFKKDIGIRLARRHDLTVGLHEEGIGAILLEHEVGSEPAVAVEARIEAPIREITGYGKRFVAVYAR